MSQGITGTLATFVRRKSSRKHKVSSINLLYDVITVTNLCTLIYVIELPRKRKQRRMVPPAATCRETIITFCCKEESKPCHEIEFKSRGSTSITAGSGATEHAMNNQAYSEVINAIT